MLNKSRLLQTSLVLLLTLASLVLLCGVFAYWTWAWLAPAPVAAAAPAWQAGGNLQAAPALFGAAREAQAPVAPSGAAIRLLGVVTATGGEAGFAVLLLEPRRILAIREGDDIAAGVRLVEVNADHIIIARGAMRETLAWPVR